VNTLHIGYHGTILKDRIHITGNCQYHYFNHQNSELQHPLSCYLSIKITRGLTNFLYITKNLKIQNILCKSISIRHNTQTRKRSSICLLKHSMIITGSATQKLTTSNVYEVVIIFQGTTMYKTTVTDTDWQ